MEALSRAVTPLVADHMTAEELYKQQVSDTAIRRLASRVGRIDRLVRVVRADQAGRPPIIFDGCPAGAWLLERAAALAVTDSAPRPLVMGRHLIALGLKPGREFATILSACYEAQLDGAFMTLEDGTAFASGVVTSGSHAPRVTPAVTPPVTPPSPAIRSESCHTQ
jgi:tRNA nucleotidyltransferase (CCA-adding enzyme)